MKWVRLAFACACLFVLGCGSDGPPKGTVNGKVVANGQPVTEGNLTFAPVAAKAGDEIGPPAMGQVKSDGTFSLGTEKEGDGAVVGRHKIRFTPAVGVVPEWDGYGQQPVAPPSPFAGMVPKEAEVEVKPGANEITIELVKGTGQ